MSTCYDYRVDSAAINAYIRTHYRKQSDAQIARHCRISFAAVDNRRRRMGLKHPPRPTQPPPIEDEIADIALRRDRKQDKSRITQLFSRLERLQRELDASLDLRARVPNVRILQPQKRSKGEATIVALLSDTHIEETVKPETIHALNEYTIPIARKRFDSYFTTLLHLIQLEQKSTTVRHLILALLGDFISNDIHDELLETTSLLPMEAIRTAEDWIITGIQYLLDNSDLQITIPCHSGNHARTTKKVRPATESGHSLEYIMYHHLKRYFASEKRVTFIIPDSYLSYVQVYDKTVAFHHGHHIRYGGGVGGLTIPANKAIAQWNRTRPADYYCFGHFHQVFDGGNFIVNGSMIGFNAFAVAIKAAYEDPAQVMFGIHSRYGKYLSRTIKFKD